MTNDAFSGGPAPSAAGLSPAQLWQLIVRRRRLVAAVVAGVVALAAVYVVRQQPQYRSHTTLRLEEPRSGRSILAAVSPLGGGGGRAAIATDVLELQSYRMAAEVVDSLALHVGVDEPERPRSQVLRQAAAPRTGVPPGVYVLERRGDGGYDVRPGEGREAPAEPVALPQRVELGTPFRIGPAVLELSPALRGDPPERIRIVVRRFEEAVESLQRSLSVYRPHPDAQIVTVEHASTDPRLAAEVPNVLAQRFIGYKTLLGRADGRSMAEFLSGQVDVYAQELRQAEDALRTFRETAQVVAPEEQADEQVRRHAALQAQREQLVAERQNLSQLLARSEASDREGSRSAYRQLAAFPTFLANPGVQDILRSLNGLEDQRTALLQRRQETNEDVELLSRRIAELEGQLHRLAVNYLASLDGQLASVNQSLARFSGTLEEIPAREIEYARLLRQAKVSEEIYTLLQTRLKESEIEQAAELGNARIVDVAQVPDEPFAPRRVRIMGVALLLGLLLGVGAAVVRESSETRVHSRADAQAATGGLPVLGMIPPIRLATGRTRRNGTGAPDLQAVNRLVARDAPSSPESEAYRSLRTSITFSSLDRPPRTLVIASATPGDGKSTSAANLAITLARQGTRTLLVDADLRKGLLHHLFGVAQEPGLTHVLMGHASLEQAARPVTLNGEREPALYVLPTGAFPPNPAEMLGSPRMRALMEEMRTRFDAVVFDAPPLNLVTDAAVLGTMADGTLLVARAGTTDRAALHHAVGQLRQVQAPVIGLILNDFEVAAAGYYGYSTGSQ